ncbi:hypothetical protein F5148DRAFT_750707 [Russula earlei]|uniref:Uncharacterized protein n=1 Tax=Russula earlei TaxID=71964 RepID=A0ACC0TUG2_9AGAM|nr:hypothetical protein F5148DRAFT_750707 [Russula earlei]
MGLMSRKRAYWIAPLNFCHSTSQTGTVNRAGGCCVATCYPRRQVAYACFAPCAERRNLSFLLPPAPPPPLPVHPLPTDFLTSKGLAAYRALSPDPFFSSLPCPPNQALPLQRLPTTCVSPHTVLRTWVDIIHIPAPASPRVRLSCLLRKVRTRRRGTRWARAITLPAPVEAHELADQTANDAMRSGRVPNQGGSSLNWNWWECEVGSMGIASRL